MMHIFCGMMQDSLRHYNNIALLRGGGPDEIHD